MKSIVTNLVTKAILSLMTLLGTWLYNKYGIHLDLGPLAAELGVVVVALLSVIWSHWHVSDLVYNPGNNAPANVPKGGSLLTRSSLLAILLALAMGLPASAQTNTPAASDTQPTNFWNNLPLPTVGQGVLSWIQNDPEAWTNGMWTAVPFFSYDFDTHRFGYGAALCHPLGSSPLYAGMRIENIAGTWTTPSINASFQRKFKVFNLFDATWVTVGGSALFNGNLAVYMGSGLDVALVKTTIKGKSVLLGVAVDMEQWTGLDAKAKHLQLRAGLAGSVTF